MKKSSLVVFIGILFGTSCVHWPFAQEPRGPKLVFEEEVFDFGEVLESEKMSHVFKVLNKGDQPLEIKAVKPG